VDLQGVEVRADQRGVHDEGLRVEVMPRGFGGRGRQPIEGGTVAPLGGEEESYEGQE
jgi:hypothetical protein